ncbi:hypothetical protein ABL78_0330 [Leptomonas seymouri]|uniref:Uncharacterized protein n=1 Tax=Leptomonas seymouri TaxID=5684 RepID=A0A0N1PFD4_LEPSE|nr:hypothetical protein ABL78_0330 [Leptomonas seymouri]|eukprot:KPI90570.1 hypothetical protein ABL78_0330 [Leptomonas seymouri]
MYMDVLEQEVEALSAEVTRLRLMVHRITQVMRAPPPGLDVHTDPLNMVPQVTSASDGRPANFQATVDSYKQLIPLIRLLLEQQQSAKELPCRNISRGRHNSKKDSSRNRRHRRHRSMRSLSSATKSSTSSSSQSNTTSATAHRSAESHSRKTSDTATSRTSSSHAPLSREAPGKRVTQKLVAPLSASTSTTGIAAASPLGAQPSAPTAAAATGRRRESLLSAEETSSRAERWGFSPGATPKSCSVVDRLRAQRGLTSQGDASGSSTDSSEDMPMVKSQTRSSATSPSSSVKRQPCGPANALKTVAVAAVPKKSHHQDAPHSTTLNLTLPRGVAASKRLDAAPASEAVADAAKSPADNGRPASLPSESIADAERSPVSGVMGTPHAASDARAVERQHGAKPSSVHRRWSTANSLEYSEQGHYSFSIYNSLANSPDLSQVPDDAGRSARTGTATAASAALEAAREMPSTKQLPPKTTVVSRAQEMLLNSSSSSSTSSDDSGAQQIPPVLAASTTTRSFGSGVVLGARQPIVVHCISGSGEEAACSALSRTIPAPMKGATTAAAAEAPSTLAAMHRSVESSSASETSSSLDNSIGAAAYQRQQARLASREPPRESSFHNYSETSASSPPVSNVNVPLQQQQQRGSLSPCQPDFSATLSQDAYSYAVFSPQYSAQGSPRAYSGIEASAEVGQAMSQSASCPQTARSESHGLFSGGNRGSLASGGYYYGYDFGTGSVSHPSMMSNAVVERCTPSSSPVFDY